MNLKPASLLFVLPVIAACQGEAPTGPEADAGSALSLPVAPEVRTVSYACESGTRLDVTLDGARALHLNYGGQDLTLQGEETGSGTAYRNAQYRWTTQQKGGFDEGRLYRGDTPLEICKREQTAAAPEPGLAPCRSEQLDLRPGQSDAAMGHRQQTFEVALKGTQPCLLSAWPAIQLEGEGTGEAPKIHRTTDSYFGPQDTSDRLTLTAERPVMFHVGWSVIPDESRGQTTCPAVTGMVVTAPGGGKLTAVAQNYEACGRGVEISPYRPTTQERQKIN